MWCVCGLGNPGRRYEQTRHNLGFATIRALAERDAGLVRKTTRTEKLYDCIEVERPGGSALLLMPLTYVNRSGAAVEHALRAYGLGAGDLLVVADDVYLPFGRLRLRPRGRAGGHNGLASIEACLGTQEYPRLRLGVGSPAADQDRAAYVLERFADFERSALSEFLARAADAVERVLDLGVQGAQPGVNAPPL